MEYATPSIHPESYIARNATIIGDVEINKNCTVLFNATLRGDWGGRIVVGEGSNIQENACLHVSADAPTIIGKNVTVGHGAIVHGCTIGDGTTVGMGSIVIDHARVGKNCLIGAGALVTGTADIPDGMLVLGSPAKAVRPLTEEEIAGSLLAAEEYLEIGQALMSQGILQTGESWGGEEESHSESLVDSLSNARDSRFHSMTSVEIATDRLKSRGLL